MVKGFCTRCGQYAVVERNGRAFKHAFFAIVIFGVAIFWWFPPLCVAMLFVGLIGGGIAQALTKGTYCENCKQVIK